MIKMMSLMFKKPGINDEDFNKWWLEIHGPMAVRTMPGLAKYVQNHLVRVPGRVYQGDGFVQFWFDDPEIEQRMRTGQPAFKSVPKDIGVDAGKFVELGKMVSWTMDEHVLVDKTTPGKKMIKMMSLMYKKPGISTEDFNKWWLEIHGPMAASTMPGLVKYVQNHLVRIPGREYQGDGFVEFWFDDPEIVQRMKAGLPPFKSVPKDIGVDAGKFVEMGKMASWTIEEYALK